MTIIVKGLRLEVSGRYWRGAVILRTARNVQKGVLQASRPERGWEVYGEIGVSRRTWEGWEKGRQIPVDKVMLRHDLVSSP